MNEREEIIKYLLQINDSKNLLIAQLQTQLSEMKAKYEPEQEPSK